MPRLIGVSHALDMILTGKPLRARQALKLGLVDDVVPASILLSTAVELALKGRKPSRQLPVKERILAGPLGRSLLFRLVSKKMVADVERYAAPHTVFASNTSSLPIADIAAQAARPQQVIGLHFLSPVDKMPLVEVIPHVGTSAKTISTTVQLAKKQGKTPIVVGDSAGFYVNRILAPYVNEALRCLTEGEPIERIDDALVKFGFPVGPIRLLDEVGIDVGTRIIPILQQAFGERFAAPHSVDKILKDDRKGRKNGRGFYLYPAKGRKSKKQPDTAIYALLGVTPNGRQAPEHIAERCVMMMLNEAARCLDEDVVRSARDGDIGAVFGIGFPPFLGGPFRYIDTLKAAEVVANLQHLAGQYGARFTPCERLLSMAEQQLRFWPALTLHSVIRPDNALG